MKRLTIAVVTLVAFFAAVNTYAVNPSTMHKHQTKVEKVEKTAPACPCMKDGKCTCMKDGKCNCPMCKEGKCPHCTKGDGAKTCPRKK